jgi:hypothetical protein
MVVERNVRNVLPAARRVPNSNSRVVHLAKAQSNYSFGMFAESRSLPPDPDPRDPFQLQRLADELPDDDDDSNEGLHDLPAYLPLSHDDSCLSAPIFNVEQFLQSRAYTSLPDLRLELRNYLAALKEELVQLINDDYEAFISLSTDLRDEGARLDKLKWPLADLKGQTLVCLVLALLIFSALILSTLTGLKIRITATQDRD